MDCSEIKLNLKKLELLHCSKVRSSTSVCPRQSDLSGPSAELHSKLSCKQSVHFISGKVFSHFLQQKQNSLLFLAGAEMIHHKSSPLLFQDQLMHSSATRVWSLVCSKSSSFPATQLAARRVQCSMTWPNQEEAVC